MSEEKPQYLIDAEEMIQPSIEIHHQTTVIRRRGDKLQEEVVPAFVKITTDFKDEMAELEPSALKVWLFLVLSMNRNTEEAHPGIRTMAKKCGMGENTVISAIRNLEARGLIEVNREDRKYNIYQFTGYVSANTKTASKNDTTASENPQTASEKRQTASVGKGLTREPEEPDNHIREKEKISISKVISSANKTMDAYLDLQRASGPSWMFREKMPDPIRDLMDVFVEETGLTCVNVGDWIETGNLWISMGAAKADVRKACERSRPNEKGYGGIQNVTRPGSITGLLNAVIGERRKTKTGGTLMEYMDKLMEEQGGRNG